MESLAQGSVLTLEIGRPLPQKTKFMLQ